MTILDQWKALSRNPLCRVHYQDRCCVKVMDRETDAQLAVAVVCQYGNELRKQITISGDDGWFDITDAEWDEFVVKPSQEEDWRKWDAAAELAQKRIAEAL